MIIRQVIQDQPQDEVGQAVAQEVEIKTIPEEPLADYCLCDLGIRECSYKEIAFYGGNGQYENDYTSFFVNKVDSTDEIKFFLIDADTDAEVELTGANAGDYGVYQEEDYYVGIVVDFDTLHNFDPLLKVARFRVEQTVFGTLVETETHEFQLVKWNIERANGTVRIETVNNGRIESGNNYGNINWKRAVRIRGFFGRETPNLVVDNYQDGDRIVTQIQDKIENEYTLETELVPNNIFKMIVFNDMLSNELFISDYNIRNVNYKGVPVTPTAITSQYFEKNRNGAYEITFTDRIQNHVKRNV